MMTRSRPATSFRSIGLQLDKQLLAYEMVEADSKREGILSLHEPSVDLFGSSEMAIPRKTRPTRTSAELIALIRQRHEDWWPQEFPLTIVRSGEHDWTAITDAALGNDFVTSIGRIVSDLRSKNAWGGQ